MKRPTRAASSLVTLLLSTTALADVATDGSLGPAVVLTGSDLLVEQALGRRTGDNLFHSFDRFDVPANGRVEFTGDPGLRHILARVTGGQASDIDGTIASSAGRADLWLINPSGIVFGSRATLDVGGNFHAATASHIRFADGAEFRADLGRSGSLTMAPPEAFGFIGTAPRPIALDGANLELAPESLLTLAAGDIRLQGDGVADTIRIENGRVLLVGASADREIRPGAVGETRAGSLLIDDGAVIDLSGSTGGQIAMGAESIVIDGSSRIELGRTASADASGQQAAFTLRAERFDLRNGARVTAGAVGEDAAAGSDIQAETIRITDGGTIETGDVSIAGSDIVLDGGAGAGRTGIFSDVAYRAADAGDIVVNGGRLRIANGARVSSGSIYAGAAGRVALDVDRLDIDGGGQVGTGILTTTDYGGYGGPIEIVAATSLSIVDGGVISSSTASDYSAGDIAIEAATIEIDGRAGDRLTGIFSNTNAYGAAGTIRLAGGVLTIAGGGSIATDTYAAGSAGRIDVMADSITIDGRDAATGISTAISSKSGSGATGAAGDISVIGRRDISLLAGSEITSSAAGSAASGYGYGGYGDYGGTIGNAGSVTIVGGTILADGSDGNGRTGFFTDIGYRSGNAGDISITGERLALVHGARVSSSSVYAGNAGRIDVNVNDLSIDGGGIVATGILTTSEQGGYGGAIAIGTAGLELVDGGVISSGTTGYSAAGDITIATKDMVIDGRGGSQITGVFSNTYGYGRAGYVRFDGDALSVLAGGRIATDTYAAGDAGSIVIQAKSATIDGFGGDTELRTDISSRSGVGSTGNAGEIKLTSTSLLIDRGGSISTETNGPGDAGSLVITADQFSLFNGGIIRSSSLGEGAAGNIDLDTFRIDFADATVLTEGRNSRGGRIRVRASERVTVRDVEITTNGIFAEDGASIIQLDSPLLALNRSRIFSLVEGIELTPQAIRRLDEISSGEANLLGGNSIVSVDTIVAATTNTDVTGIINDIDSNLQSTGASLARRARLINRACAGSNPSGSSSFQAARSATLTADPSAALRAGEVRSRAEAC